MYKKIESKKRKLFFESAIYSSSYSVCPSLSSRACSSSLSSECPWSPLVISFIPITTVAVGGNSKSSSVGFFSYNICHYCYISARYQINMI